jgi:hypothetical protein
MQCDLMYTCEVSCPGENLSSFSDDTQSTENENRCGYGGQCFQLWQDRCLPPAATGTYSNVLYDRMCHAYASTRKDRHMKLANFAQELDTAG